MSVLSLNKLTYVSAHVGANTNAAIAAAASQAIAATQQVVTFEKYYCISSNISAPLEFQPLPFHQNIFFVFFNYDHEI